ncbi:unnamed protein product, partial [Sphacelaria rigidula]
LYVVAQGITSRSLPKMFRDTLSILNFLRYRCKCENRSTCAATTRARSTTLSRLVVAVLVTCFQCQLAGVCAASRNNKLNNKAYLHGHNTREGASDPSHTSRAGRYSFLPAFAALGAGGLASHTHLSRPRNIHVGLLPRIRDSSTTAPGEDSCSSSSNGSNTQKLGRINQQLRQQSSSQLDPESDATCLVAAKAEIAPDFNAGDNGSSDGDIMQEGEEGDE